MTGKYTPLENHLRELPASQNEVTLTFGQIEGILKSSLPSSAYEDERWWRHEKEGNHVHGRSWSTAGWKIQGLNVNEKRVTFARMKSE